MRDNSNVRYPPPDFKRLFYGAFTKYGANNPNRNLYQYFTTITVRLWASDFPLLPLRDNLINPAGRPQDVKSTRTLIGKGECTAERRVGRLDSIG